jgi:hypothetical protein
MVKILTAILDSFKVLNPTVTAALALCTFLAGAFNFGNEMWSAVIAKVATLTLSEPMAVTVLTGFGFVDYCFPLNELFTFITVWGATFLICAAIRMLKSWIPLIGA